MSLVDRRVVVCIGAGGVGKTTIAASLGIAGARAGRRTNGPNGPHGRHPIPRWIVAFYAHFALLTDRPPLSVAELGTTLEVEPTGTPTTQNALLRFFRSLPAALALLFPGIVSASCWSSARSACSCGRRCPSRSSTSSVGSSAGRHDTSRSMPRSSMSRRRSRSRAVRRPPRPHRAGRPSRCPSPAPSGPARLIDELDAAWRRSWLARATSSWWRRRRPAASIARPPRARACLRRVYVRTPLAECERRGAVQEARLDSRRAHGLCVDLPIAPRLAPSRGW